MCSDGAGFDAGDDSERMNAEALRKELGIHPFPELERLTAKDETKKSAECLLNRLCGGSDREFPCCRDTPLRTMSTRGENGLAEDLEEVRKKIVPLIRGGPFSAG